MGNKQGKKKGSHKGPHAGPDPTISLPASHTPPTSHASPPVHAATYPPSEPMKPTKSRFDELVEKSGLKIIGNDGL